MVNLKQLSTIIAVAFFSAGILPLLDTKHGQATEKMQAFVVGDGLLEVGLTPKKVVQTNRVRLAYSCSSSTCTCSGDEDCNNMYTKAGCADGGQCQLKGGVSCSCTKKATLGTPPKTSKGAVNPVAVGGIKQPGTGTSPPKGKGGVNPVSVGGNK